MHERRGGRCLLAADGKSTGPLLRSLPHRRRVRPHFSWCSMCFALSIIDSFVSVSVSALSDFLVPRVPSSSGLLVMGASPCL